MLRPSPRRRATASLALVGLLAVAPGCSLFGSDGDPPPTATTPATTTTTTPAPSTEVLDQGAEPRRAVRVQLREGRSSTATITVDLDLEQDGTSGPVALDLPKIVETVRLTVGAVDGDQADVSFTFVDLAVADDARLTGSERTRVEASLRRLAGLTGRGRIDTSGRILDFTYTPPDGADETATALAGQLRSQLDDLLAPLPALPVGVGARWRSTTYGEVAGTPVPITTVYEVTEIEGDTIRYSSTSDSDIAARPLPDDVLPAGATGRIESGRTSSRGTGALTLGSLIAVVDVRSTSTERIAVTPAKGRPTTIEQRATVHLTVTSSP